MTNITAEPPWLDKADNSWQMVAGTLVGMQSVPGLVILYGSIVKKKWAVNSAFMALYAFAAVLVCWSLWGFRMSFGTQMLPFWGVPNSVLDAKYMQQQAGFRFERGEMSYPMATFIYYQFAFAALTVILVAGSVLGRMNFWAWMLFVPLWLTFSYTVGAFSLWGGGFLYRWGVIDFSGGYVIHVSSGVAGLVAAYWVGPRLPQDRERFPPNNVLLMLCGTGFLWLGWNGFNGGAPNAPNLDSSIALLNTNIAAATALLSWTALDIFCFRKPSVIGAVQGMFAGLVCITPAAGVVHGWGAIVYGLAAGTIPWFTMMKMHRQIRFMAQIDDTLGVFHTHAVAGLVGGLLTGVFLDRELCEIFDCRDDPETGVISSRGANWGQLWQQLVGAAFVVVWNLVVTTIILLVISLFVPLRMSDEELVVGDDAAHGEEAYALWEDGPDKYDDSVRSQHWNTEAADVEMQRHVVAMDRQQQQQQQSPGVQQGVTFNQTVFFVPPNSTAKTSPAL